MFMFVERGRIKYWIQGGRRGMILAPDRELADAFAKHFKNKHGVRISVAEIGTVEGETLEDQLNASLKGGANCAFVVQSIEGDVITLDVWTPPPKNAPPNN
jgi:hypothetical protein